MDVMEVEFETFVVIEDDDSSETVAFKVKVREIMENS
jgi:hypothetical protein